MGLTADGTSCNTWYYSPDNQSHCVCGNTLAGNLQCSEKDERVYLIMDYCMTQQESGELVAGFCRYGYQKNSSLTHNRIYTLLPEHPQDLNKFQCEQHHRKGLLCSECMQGYGPAVYAFKYTLSCSKCSEMSTSVATLLYMTLELVPVTILFFLVMTFRINFTSGPLFGYIMFCQLQVVVVQVYLPLQYSILANTGPVAKVVYYMVFTLAGVWSLDFLKVNNNIIPPFCISDNITDLTAFWLDYVLVAYTIILVLITHMCIWLYSSNYKIFTLLWKPIHYFCIKIRQRWNSEGSIIHAYATLLLLMFLRLNVMFYNANKVTYLTTTDNRTSQRVSAQVLALNPHIHCYTPEHIPYLVIPTFILFAFGVCPSVFICLYPTKVFTRAAMHCCSARVRIAMSVFADVFQGCYKDGLNGTRDYRKTPAIIMLLIIIRTFIITFRVDSRNYFMWMTTAVSIFLSLIVSYVRPYKSTLMNLSLSFHLIVTGLLGVLFNMWTENFVVSSHALSYASITLLAVPHVLMLLWVGYRLCVRALNTHRYSILLPQLPNN